VRQSINYWNFVRSFGSP